MNKMLIAIELLSVVLVAGCIQQTPTYQCRNGVRFDCTSGFCISTNSTQGCNETQNPIIQYCKEPVCIYPANTVVCTYRFIECKTPTNETVRCITYLGGYAGGLDCWLVNQTSD